MKRVLAGLCVWIAFAVGAPAQEAPPKLPAGFAFELVVQPRAQDKLVGFHTCCFDEQGRLLVAEQNGPVLLCAGPGKDGAFAAGKVYCDQVRDCRGMSWIRGQLWLVGVGPDGVGLYRCQPALNAEKIEAVTLIHAFQGELGETGPHGVVQGPDGLIYCVLGEQAAAQFSGALAKDAVNPDQLAANSPISRPLVKKKGKDIPPLVGLVGLGGTVLRLSPDGKKVSVVACGLRTARALAFDPTGELFTADSDLEANADLPWYRPLRLCHCPPGADFVWSAGPVSAPDYYLDAVPAIAAVGRGLPGGLTFYDHHAFPQEYRGACFLADRASGTIDILRCTRNGASYKARVERFCQKPALQADGLCVGPDGALYFVTGGSGVYRIAYRGMPAGAEAPTDLAAWPQSQAAWSQKRLATAAAPAGSASLSAYIWGPFLRDEKIATVKRIRMTLALQQLGQRPELAQVQPLFKADEPELRAHAAWLVGINGFEPATPELLLALGDSNALVRRRACEALLRLGAEPPIAALWPLLSERDRFVRQSARALLERIDPKKWVHKVWTEPKSYREVNEAASWHGIVALCHMGKAPAYAEEIFGRVHGNQTSPSQGSINYPINLLEWLRTTQLALAHTERRPIWTAYIARQCLELFPHEDARVNRELALLLAELQRGRQLDQPIQSTLLKAMTAAKTDHAQQLHYAWCMRSLRQGWTPETMQSLTQWHATTRTWNASPPLTTFLDSVYKDCTQSFPGNK